MNRFFVALIAVLTLNTPVWAAQELAIKDTSGFVRAVAEAADENTVEFEVTDANGGAADGAEVTLTNQETGATLTATSVNGKVTFTQVTPGVWTVSSPVSGLTFAKVTLVGLGAGAATSSGAFTALVVGGGVAGGTVAIVNASDDGDDDEKTPLSPAS